MLQHVNQVLKLSNLQFGYMCINRSYFSCCKLNQTRMHSSRMRTVRSLSVCCSLFPGGCLVPGGVWPGGCLLHGGVCSRGVSGPGGLSAPGGSGSGGGIPACTEADTPPVDRILDTRL